MKAEIEQHGDHDCVVVLTPETTHEAILLGVWMRFDENVARLSVTRYANGRIETVTIEAGTVLLGD